MDLESCDVDNDEFCNEETKPGGKYTIQFWGVGLDIPSAPSVMGGGEVVVGGGVKILWSKCWGVVEIGDCKSYL